MKRNHSPTLLVPVHLNVNELDNTSKTSYNHHLNQIKKVQMHYFEPVKICLNHFQPHKDAA